jgi:hypothetical protein
MGGQITLAVCKFTLAVLAAAVLASMRGAARFNVFVAKLGGSAGLRCEMVAVVVRF